MFSTNPYESPKSDPADPRLKIGGDRASANRLYLGWLLVFALNVVAPLFFGWNITGSGGRVGMFLAMLVLLALGFWICASARQIGFPLVVGGVAVALSQVFPILQVMAGGLAFAVAEAVGVCAPTKLEPSAETVAAGFIVTMTTGGLLVAASLVAGLAIRAVLALRRS